MENSVFILWKELLQKDKGEQQRKNKVDQSIYEKMFDFRKNQSNANKNEIIF